MIIYFSGTGNSEYVAKRLSIALDEDTFDLFAKSGSDGDFLNLADERIVVVCPTYSWRIPKFIDRWLRRSKFVQGSDIYFVMTCGGDIANSSKYNKKLCKKISLTYKGTFEIVMPENYIALFDSPSVEEEGEILLAAEDKIQELIDILKRGDALPESKVGTLDRLKSGIVNNCFYIFCLSAKPFYSTDKCISCGKCQKMCPLGNIKMADGKPKWGKNCTQCMSCISRCPVEAIEYGKHTQGKRRYVCPQQVELSCKKELELIGVDGAVESE